MASLAELTDTYQDDPGIVNSLPVQHPDIVIGGNGEPTRITVRPEVSNVGSRVDKILNSLFRDDDKRYQLWPEKVIRGGLTAAGETLAGNVPQWAVDKDTGEVHTSPQMIEKAQEISALAGTGGLAEADATLGSTAFLRPALKYKDKIYKGKEGQQHQDVIPKELYPEFEQMAMNGEDISHYNFGFMNHKGQFLDREKALEYAVNEGLLSPHDASYGALTSTMTNHPIATRDPYTYTDAQNAAIKIYMKQGKSISEAEKLVFGSDAYTTIAKGIPQELTTQLLVDSSKLGVTIENSDNNRKSKNNIMDPLALQLSKNTRPSRKNGDAIDFDPNSWLAPMRYKLPDDI